MTKFRPYCAFSMLGLILSQFFILPLTQIMMPLYNDPTVVSEMVMCYVLFGSIILCFHRNAHIEAQNKRRIESKAEWVQCWSVLLFMAGVCAGAVCMMLLLADMTLSVIQFSFVWFIITGMEAMMVLLFLFASRRMLDEALLMLRFRHVKF